MRRVLAALAASSALLVGCGSSGSSPTATGAPPADGRAAGVTAAADQGPCATPSTGGERTVRFTSGGVERSALLSLPASPAGERVPVILALHPSGADGRQMASYTGLSPAAAKAGMAVVYPDSVHAGEWRLRARSGAPDVSEIRALLAALPAAACVDPDRVVATGVSNGAGMAARLGCALPGELVGIAPVAPGLRAIAPCPSGPPLEVLEIHGRADQVVPYRGRGPKHAGAVLPWLRGWAARDECRPLPDASVPRRGVLQMDWRSCTRGGGVRHLALAGTDHGWPGSGGPFPHRDPTGLDATAVVVAWAAKVTHAA